MKFIWTAALAVLIPVSVSAQSLEPTSDSLGGMATWTLVAANAADLGSTIDAVSQPGVREANPLLGSQLRTIIPMKIALSAAHIAGFHVVARMGHPKIAKVVAYAESALMIGIAAHNVALARRMR